MSKTETKERANSLNKKVDKGHGLSYAGIHAWVRRNKTKPPVCESCKRSHKRIEAANISGKYLKDLNDYKWLCAPCHKSLDRIHKRQREKARIRWQNMTHCKKAGHPLSDGHYQYKRPNGTIYRECKTCNKNRTKQLRAKREKGAA